MDATEEQVGGKTVYKIDNIIGEASEIDMPETKRRQQSLARITLMLLSQKCLRYGHEHRSMFFSPEGLKSTAGGIGVENLQGSGLIAGETSRAYNEALKFRNTDRATHTRRKPRRQRACWLCRSRA